MFMRNELMDVMFDVCIVGCKYCCMYELLDICIVGCICYWMYELLDVCILG